MVVWNISKYLIQFGFPGHERNPWYQHFEVVYEGSTEGGAHHVYYIGPFCFSIEWLGEEQ